MRCMLSVFFAAILLCFTSCVPAESVSMRLPMVDDYYSPEVVYNRKNLRLGIVPGPYGGMFTETIFPSLERLGYTLEVHEYTSYTEPNIALAAYEIDLNMFQHYVYLNDFRFEYNLDLSAITEIPTLPMGMFSGKYGSIAEIEYGASIAIPDDPTNISRSLRFLEFAGLIRLDPFINKVKATQADIIDNPHGLQFVHVNARYSADALGTQNLALINGNYIISSGLNPVDAIYSEVLAESYFNIIAIRTEDLDQQFARDIIDVIDSDEFKNAISAENGKYVRFQMPKYFADNRR